jgi:hypothetical protein
MVSPDGRRSAAVAESAPIRTTPLERQEFPMAKGQQRSNKEAKKPKKDPTAVPKPIKAGAPPITTAIIERGKKKP